MPNPIESLRAALKRPDALIFVGAGVSVWSGLPTWSGLIEKLSAFMETHGLATTLVDRERARGDLLQAASYGFDALSRYQRREFLRNACSVGEAIPSELHKAIAKIGPVCFVTTNYDQLLDRAIRECHPNEYYRVVGNTSALEVADVIKSNSSHFIFKPHGDIEDCDSIILTREDYRTFHGSRTYVSEAMRTLLATRPIVFIGYGLKDPDFVLLTDILASIYSGSPQEHYAIIPDVSDDERSYWRRNYGVHLVSYPLENMGGNSHESLLALLTELSNETREQSKSVGRMPDRAAQTLALLRHAARMRLLDAKTLPTDEMPIRLIRPRRTGRSINERPEDAFLEHRIAYRGLMTNRSKLYITGAPGAGKTYAAKRAVALMATNLQESILLDEADSASQSIPIYIDLKSYSGDLRSAIEDALPADLTIESIRAANPLALYLDGVNEVAAEYHQSGRLLEDLANLCLGLEDASIVVISRGGIDLEELGFIEYQLDEVDREYVVNAIGQEVNASALTVLQRPFFLRLALNDRSLISPTLLPQHIYLGYFKGLREKFLADFGEDLNFVTFLAGISYDLINEGRQTFSLGSLDRAIRAGRSTQVKLLDLLNWLISESVLVALPGDVLAFSHHSLSEYLAAYRLSELHKISQEYLASCLRHHSWDVAILLSLGFLPREEAYAFLHAVLEADPTMALRAVNYLESQRGEWGRECLRAIASGRYVATEEWPLRQAMAQLIPELEMVDALWEICSTKSALSESAAKVLVQVEGGRARSRLIESIFHNYPDYNYCTGLGRAVSNSITEVEARSVFEQLDELESGLDSDLLAALARNDSNNEFAGLFAACASLIASLPAAELREIAPPSATGRILTRRVIVTRLTDDGSLDAVRLIADYILAGDIASIFALGLQVAPYRQVPEVVESVYSPELLRCLIEGVTYPGGWAVNTLDALCASSERWRMGLKCVIPDDDGIVAACLFCAVGDYNSFERIVERAIVDERRLSLEPWNLLQHCEVPWSEHKALLLTLLTCGDIRIMSSALYAVSMTDAGETVSLRLELGDPGPWADLLGSTLKADYHIGSNLGRFLAVHADPASRESLIALMAERSDFCRHMVTKLVLPHVPPHHLPSLPESLISWMLADLTRSRIDTWSPSVLANISDEKFVEQRLLPLLSSNPSELLRDNLYEILLRCGKRHGRRYVSGTGDVLG